MDYNEIPELLTKLIRSTDIERKELCCKLEELITQLNKLIVTMGGTP